MIGKSVSLCSGIIKRRVLLFTSCCNLRKIVLMHLIQPIEENEHPMVIAMNAKNGDS